MKPVSKRFLHDLIPFTTYLETLAPVTEHEVLMLPLPTLRQFASTLRDPNLPCVLIHSNAAHSAIHNRYLQARPGHRTAVQPPMRKCYIEFTEPLDIAHHDSDVPDLVRSLLITNQRNSIIKITAITTSKDWNYARFTGTLGQLTAVYDLNSGVAYADPKNLLNTPVPSQLPDGLNDQQLVPLGQGKWRPGIYEKNAVIYTDFTAALLVYLQKHPSTPDAPNSADYHRWHFVPPPLHQPENPTPPRTPGRSRSPQVATEPP